MRVAETHRRFGAGRLLFVRFDNARAAVRLAMNNAFGFGGNNCALLFGAAA